MDERQFSQMLRDIAEQEIPDTMNLWPQVQERAASTAKRAARSRLSWAAVMLISALLVAAAVYAVDRILQMDDPGLEGAEAANLITDLNQSQTLDGLTVTLDYAYADANRVTVGYVISGEVDPYTSYEVTSVGLIDDLGRGFNPLFGQQPTMPTTDLSEGERPQHFSIHGAATYDACLIEGNPDRVGLHFVLNAQRTVYSRQGIQEMATVAAGTPAPTLSLEDNNATSTAFFATLAPTQTAEMEQWFATATQGAIEVQTLAPTFTAQAALDTSNCAQYGGGGGGGGGPVERIDPLGPFAFDFRVPFIPAQVYEQPLTAEANGVTLTLKRVAITPSFTRATLCLAGEGLDPETLYFDQMAAGITIGGQTFDLDATPESSAAGGGSYSFNTSNLITLLPAAENMPDNCLEVLINQSLYAVEGEWALVIDRFSRRMGGVNYSIGDTIGADETTVVLYSANPAGTLERVQALLPQFEAEIVYSEDFRSEVVQLKLPNERVEALASVLEEALTERLEGPWAFRFTPPQAG